MIASRLPGGSRHRDDAVELARRAQVAVCRSGVPAGVTAVSVRPREQWVDTGLRMQPGVSVTVLTSGTLWAARALGLGFTADVGFWLRTGDGAVISMLGTAMTVVAEEDGPLRVCAAEPGVFDENGVFDPDVPRMPLSGTFEVVLIQWHGGDPIAALSAAARNDPELLAPALVRARSPWPTPTGWSHHPRIGAAEIFTEAIGHDHCPEISCVTRRNVGILRRPADAEITDELTLSWSWQVDELPSRLAENTALTHDYLSVAVEFDDGRDLTWIWSSELPVSTVFRCPLAYWCDRETHLVIRSGRTHLGQWTTEERGICDDVRRALDPPYPRRIVAIWLIANSVCQQGVGICRFRSLRLADRPSLTDDTKAVP